MDGAQLSALAQIASTCGAVAVVVLFLRAWGEDRKVQSAAENDRNQALEHNGEACHAHNVKREERLIATIDRSVDVVAKNTEVLGAVKQVLEHVKD